jgi:hypothetical protein
VPCFPESPSGRGDNVESWLRRQYSCPHCERPLRQDRGYPSRPRGWQLTGEAVLGALTLLFLAGVGVSQAMDGKYVFLAAAGITLVGLVLLSVMAAGVCRRGEVRRRDVARMFVNLLIVIGLLVNAGFVLCVAGGIAGAVLLLHHGFWG